MPAIYFILSGSKTKKLFYRIRAEIRLSSLFLLASLWSAPGLAEVTVEISNLHSGVYYANTVRLKPKASEIAALYDTPYKDRYVAAVHVQGGTVQVVGLDMRDINTKNPNPRFLFNRLIGNTQNIEIPPLPSKEGAAVVFRNSHNSNIIDLRVSIFQVGKRPPAVIAQIKELFELPIRALQRIYVVPSFKVSMKPCGFVNAYSNVDIVVCAELIANLATKGLSQALYPILLHEMAHSLLYLWNLPGYDNEDIADEFAAAFLAKYFPEDIETYVKWLEGNDSVSEAVRQLVNGDRHTISIQRARNMKAALAKPDDLMARWDRLLAPYRRSAYSR